jgi:hypothetical protein
MGSQWHPPGRLIPHKTDRADDTARTPELGRAIKGHGRLHASPACGCGRGTPPAHPKIREFASTFVPKSMGYFWVSARAHRRCPKVDRQVRHPSAAKAVAQARLVRLARDRPSTPIASWPQTGRRNAATATTTPMARLASMIALAFARSAASATGSTTSSVLPSSPKLKIPREPNPAQNLSHAWR